eukprot:TRINITY_DN4037_c0_g2_i2.p1 TRINITY_DN4037_c0_g2~~TRINITY_DN4037_c0_g2_i2.p1  ORF type:complete len:240 (+),score=75.29 TRINITY_DN4037_c0_g2_i2:49-720(+)
MSVLLGQVVPNFKAQTSEGPIDFHDWIGDGWAVLFSHPADYTPVCTTELGHVAKIYSEFEKRKVKVIALSCDPVEDHKKWIKDIKAVHKLNSFPYSIIADESREIAIRYGMVDPNGEKGATALSCRAVFIVGPGKKLKLSILYPASTGRDFGEILRVIDSLQLTEKYPLATPANWRVGQKCMIPAGVAETVAKETFPLGWDTINVPSGKPYLRMTPQPNMSKL